MKVFRIIYCLCTFLFIAAQNILGCSPYGYPNAPLNYKVAKTEKIYIGKVISKSSTIKSRDDYSYRQIRVKFQIVQALKGINNEIQEIILEEPLKKHRTSCYRRPPDFKKGEQWIIEDSSAQNWEVRYFLNGFIGKYGNFSKYSADKDQTYVEQLEKAIKNPVTAIYGEVQTFWAGSFISDAMVVARREGLEFLTKTGKYGEFSFENIPEGKYKIQIHLPYKYDKLFGGGLRVFNEQTNASNLEYEVTLNSGDADYYFAVVSEMN